MPTLTGIQGQKVAILAANGVDDAELEAARRALSNAGAATVVVSADPLIRPRRADAPEIAVDIPLERAHTADFVALVLLGGSDSVERLRGNPRAVQLVREFMASDKPVA